MKNLVIFLCIFAYATATPGFIPGGPGFPGGSAYPGILGPRPAMFPRVSGGPFGISPGVAGPGAAYAPMVTGGPAVSLGPIVHGGPALYASGGDIGTGVPGIYSSGSAAPIMTGGPALYSVDSSPGLMYTGGASSLLYSGSPGTLSGYTYDRSGSALYTPGSSAYSTYTGPAISGTIGSAPVAYDLSGSARAAGITYAPTSTAYGSFINTRPAIYTAQPAYSGTSTLRVVGAEGTGIAGGRALYAGQATTGLTGVEYPGRIYQSSAPGINTEALNSGFIASTNPASAGLAVHSETSAGIMSGTDVSRGGAVVAGQQSGVVTGGTLNGV